MSQPDDNKSAQTDNLPGQAAALFLGANAFAPYVDRLQADFGSERFVDWATVILSQTMQTTVVSIYKLLPPAAKTAEAVDMRSLATLVRNVVDTHDVIDMMLGEGQSTDERHLNRQLLGHYMAARIAHVQRAVDAAKAQQFFPDAQSTYWARIQQSPLYEKRMARLKSGESIFYKTRAERLIAACARHADFVGGVVADLSTYVHSVPPALWLRPAAETYGDSEHNRDLIAVWLRISNYFFARSIRAILHVTSYEKSPNLDDFLNHHREVFSG